MADETKDKAKPAKGEDAGTTGKKVVLDLLEAGKPTRGARRKQQIEDEERRRNSLEEAKKNALNLFEDEEKPKKKGGAKHETGSALPRIGGAGESAAPAGGVVDPLAEALKGAKGAKGTNLAEMIKQMAVASSHAHPLKSKGKEKEPEIPHAPAPVVEAPTVPAQPVAEAVPVEEAPAGAVEGGMTELVVLCTTFLV